MRKRLWLNVAFLTVLAVALPAISAGEAEDWKKEFDSLCARTADVDSLRTEELAALIEKCDKLMPKLEALDEAPRKVYTKRLQSCRNFFKFMMDSKEGKLPAK